MPLFKYCNSNGKLILQNLEIKVTPPNELNDHREMVPVVENSNPQVWADSFVQSKINDPDYYRRNAAAFPGVRSFAEYQRLAARVAPKVTKTVADKSPDLDNNLQAASPDLVSKKWGFISLSETAVEDLMWAHYADQHGGLLVELDETALPSEAVYQCEYSDAPVKYDPSSPDGAATLELLAKRKKSGWSYEREHRLVVALSACRKAMAGASTLHLLRVDAKAIISVTMGLRAPDALKDEIIAALKNPLLKHVTLWKIAEDKQLNLHRVTVGLVSR